MSGYQNVGKAPDSDSSLVPKSYFDAQASSLLVTTGFVNSQIATVTQPLVNQTYVDNADAALAHKTAVDTADLGYLASTLLNAANGVAGLTSTGMAKDEQIPNGVPTRYPVLSYNAISDGQLFLAPGALHTVTTSNLREYLFASIPIPDPGYPWVPISLGLVQGGDPTFSADPGRTVGTGNYGLCSVMSPSGVDDTVYGVALCNSSFRYDFHKVKPYAPPGATPLTQPPIHGARQLGMYGCCWAGSEYTYSGGGLNFYVLVFPAMGI